VLALAALAAASLLAAPGGAGEVRIEAPSITLDVGSGTYRLSGGVLLARGLVTVRARQASWDPATGVVEARGDVLLVESGRAVHAEALTARLDGRLAASDVTALVLDGSVDLRLATGLAEVRRAGRVLLTAHAERAEGDGARLSLRGTRLTLCDCPSGPPTWELRAGRVEMGPGRRASLSWPVLWVTPRLLGIDRPVPVLAFPWLSVPLQDRATGLLTPVLGSSFASGFTAGQPVFVTLGQGADLTLTPRWAFGRPRADVVAGLPAVRGPGLALEGRWAPAAGTSGRLEVDALWDLDEEAAAAGVPGADGLRVAVTGQHDQLLSPRVAARADLDLVGDPLHARDFTPDLLQRDATRRRSAALLSARGDDGALELSLAWLEPVDRSGRLATVPYGLFGARLPAFHRWPQVVLEVLPRPLAGPLLVAGRLGLARFAPARGATSDGGRDGLGPGDAGFSRDTADPSELDGRWQPGERLAASRADARLELSAPLRLGPVALTPFVRGAAAGHLFDAVAGPAATGWGVVGASASAEWGRRLGGRRHLVGLEADWRLVGGVLGDGLPTWAGDAWDRPPAAVPGAPAGAVGRLLAAAPPGTTQQLRVAATTRLLGPGGRRLAAAVGQEVDLRRGGLAEAFATVSGTAGPVSGEATARTWSEGRPPGAPTPAHRAWLDRLSEATVRVRLGDGRGDQLRAGLAAIGPGGSGRLLAGADVLFDPRPAPLGPLAQATLGATLVLGSATLAWDAILPARATEVARCRGQGTRTVSAWQAQQHAASLGWVSPCGCFRARVTVQVDDCGEVSSGLAVDLGRLGGTSAR
jgi:LPS-assembly protein